MSPELISLLLNKYTLGGLAAVVALIVAYFKGHSAATRQAEADQIQAQAALQSKLRAAEAKNQHLEKKGEKTNEIINSAKSIDELISLFNALQAGKSGSEPSDPNSK